MVSFSIPSERGFFTFSIEPTTLLFAGSRKRHIDKQVCDGLIAQFGKLGFSFLVGCASGVDQCFREALYQSDYADDSMVACAFRDRAERLKGVYPLYVVPDGLPPRVALAKRTLWMTSRCSLLILFPSDPIGRGSALAFKSAIYNNKPVFVVTPTRPAKSTIFTVFIHQVYLMLLTVTGVSRQYIRIQDFVCDSFPRNCENLG